MKSVTTVGILAIASLLTGCRSTPAVQTNTHQAASTQAASAQSASAQSETPKSEAPQSTIDIVRNGYLESNKTTTLGRALEGTYKNGAWKSFTSDKGETVVEFDASEPFGEANSAPISCMANLSCAALNKKISDFCSSPAGWDQPTKEYHKESDRLWAKVAEVRKQQSILSIHDGDYANKAHDLSEEQSQLQAQAMSLHEPDNSCFQDSDKQHANDPVAIVVQFTVNHDETFQYHSNSMGLSSDELFEKIYN